MDLAQIPACIAHKINESMKRAMTFVFLFLESHRSITRLSRRAPILKRDDQRASGFRHHANRQYDGSHRARCKASIVHLPPCPRPVGSTLDEPLYAEGLSLAPTVEVMAFALDRIEVGTPPARPRNFPGKRFITVCIIS